MVMIGAGNVGTHLSLALKSAGHNIMQVYSRTEGRAGVLAKKLDTSYATDINAIYREADIYILSLNDNVIPEILNYAVLKGKFLLHTAGSIGLDIFEGITDNYGVIYPFQTFSVTRDVDFREVPVCVEANTKHNQDILMDIGRSISGDVHVIDSEKRQYLHLAGVFACNFVNQMYYYAKKVLDNQGLPFDLIKPLLSETAEKARDILPEKAQTGPAVRNDRNIIDKHISLLSGAEKMQKMYNFVTESIINNNLKM